jgi:osmotically-inducible protein OsmY
MDVRVKNGVVYLNGHITGTTSQSRIRKAIRAIPGILGIQNNLVLDDKLTNEVAASLGTLEHTYACKFFTGVSHGVVSLNGIVSDVNVNRGEDIAITQTSLVINLTRLGS